MAERDAGKGLPVPADQEKAPGFWGRWVAPVVPYLLGGVTISLFLWNSWWAGHFGFRILGTIVLLVLYYRAEALEVAFTTLYAKDHDVLAGDDRKLLDDFANHKEVFFEAREWLVIGLVIGLTFLSDFHHLTIPGREDHEFEWLRIILSLLFTMVVVLWLCQSPAKAGALKDPLAVLRRSTWLWAFLKRAGLVMQRMDLFSPGEQFGRLLRLLSPHYKNGQDLQPSQSALYHASLKRYGYSLHEMQETVEISSNGAAKQTQTGLIYVVRGAKKQFLRWLRFDSKILLDESGEVAGSKEVKIFEVSSFSQEVDEEGLKQLDSIFNGQYEGQHVVDVNPETSLVLGKKAPPLGETEKVLDPLRADFTITTRDALPEGAERQIRGKDGKVVYRRTPAIGVRYAFEVSTEKEGFHVSTHDPIGCRSDCIFKVFEFPCRLYKLKITLKNDGPGCHHEWGEIEPKAILLEDDHPLEAQRIRYHFLNRSEVEIKIWYPIPGFKYRIDLNFRRVQ